MSREAYGGFCESRRVRLPPATYQGTSGNVRRATLPRSRGTDGRDPRLKMRHGSRTKGTAVELAPGHSGHAVTVVVINALMVLPSSALVRGGLGFQFVHVVADGGLFSPAE